MPTGLLRPFPGPHLINRKSKTQNPKLLDSAVLPGYSVSAVLTDDQIPFQFPGAAKSTRQVSEIVAGAGTVYLESSSFRHFRLPSNLNQLARLNEQLKFESDIEWLVEPETAKRLSPAEEIAQLREECTPFEPQPTRLRLMMNEVTEHFVDDQVVIVQAGIGLKSLQAQLAEQGQCLSLPPPDLGWSRMLQSLTVGQAINFNFPHGLEAQCGNWRDWILGVTVVLADGTIAKAGSQAVKNVAGYDVQKLFVGARGTLGVITEVILRTYPVKALPQAQVQVREPASFEASLWIQRTLRTDFEAAVTAAGDQLLEADLASCTLWAQVPAAESLNRFPHDWVIRSRAGANNLVIEGPMVPYLQKAKSIFDPTNKLSPGELGIF